jgi:formate hydrogenlyase subunit 3/multisubunit Na+/H+ antiporter MnhD subunit
VSLAAEILLPLVAGTAAVVVVLRWPTVAFAVALLAAAGTAILAIGGSADDALVIGRAGLEASATTRAIAAGWAADLVLIMVLAAPGGRTAEAALLGGTGLLGLAAALAALAVDDATLAFAALAAGGIATVAGAVLGRWFLGGEDPPATARAGRALGAVGGAALVGLAIASWSQSPVGPLASGVTNPIVEAGSSAAIGLAILAMAAAMVLRTGAIPAHLWAARLVGVVSPLAVPGILGFGAAAFTIVAAGWAAAALGSTLDGLDRGVIVIAALASIVFGGLASLLHDDVEHVLGYSMVQDAGVALLAFAAPRGDIADALASWVIATAALRTALAGWIAASRWMFGTDRLSELRGWARRAPLLGLAVVLILIGSVGIPGMALFDARRQLATAAVGDPLAIAVVVVALSPLLALGRLLVAGVGRASPAVASASDERVGRSLGRGGGWSRGGVLGSVRAAAAVLRANEGLGVGLVALLLAVLGLAFAALGVGAFAVAPGS